MTKAYIAVGAYKRSAARRGLQTAGASGDGETRHTQHRARWRMRVPEGQWQPPRPAIVEFDLADKAEAFYHSRQQFAAATRRSNSQACQTAERARQRYRCVAAGRDVKHKGHGLYAQLRMRQASGARYVV